MPPRYGGPDQPFAGRASAPGSRQALQRRHERDLRVRLRRAERRIGELEAAAAESARLGQEVLQRNRELLALSSIARALNQAVGLEEVLRRAVDCVVEAVGVDASMVRLVQGDELVIVAHRGLSDEFVAAGKRMPIAHSTAGMVVQSGSPQVIDDCRNDERMVLPSAARQGVASMALLPMIVSGRVVGVLGALSYRPRRFTAEDVRVLGTMGAEIGVAVESARLYEAERRRSASLEKLDQLKTEFVLAISHELRTPMAIVKGSLDAVWEGWDRVAPERRRAYVAVARSGAGRLKRLLDDLLLVSRIETRGFVPRLESVALQPLIADVVAELLAEHPGRRIDALVPADLPPVLADPSALGEIVSNLLDNAIKYSAPDKPVVLAVAVCDAEVRLSVVDQGLGIAAQDMGRLFQRFERIDSTVRSQAGAGLGLYISRRLAESMGGRIWAESVPCCGSTFTVALPLAAGPAVDNPGSQGARVADASSADVESGGSIPGAVYSGDRPGDGKERSGR